MTMTPLVKVNNLNLRFENQLDDYTLSDINFELNHGESVLLLGPSGCGKSTLTFCLNGLYPRELDGVMEGEILINGNSTTYYKPGELSQNIGVVFQDPETQFCMSTVEDEVAFGLENICVPQTAMRGKIDEALALVDLLEYKKGLITSLSGGQKQKLALACILALEPDLLILDEPTANLDPITTEDLIKSIKRIKAETNCALIVIEHQLDGWTELAERCILLNSNGKVFYDGILREAISTNQGQLKSEGIWLPKVTQYVLKQGDQRIAYDIPLTVQEFSAQAYKWDPIIWEAAGPVNYKTSDVIMEVKEISWTTKQHKIIDNVSLSLYAGEFVAILGANGSGKTSLSRILAGIQRPSVGTIRVKGRRIDDWGESNLREVIGYVFQNPEHQFITNTVFDEVAFSLRIKGVPEEEVTIKVHSILEVCGLLKLENEHPYTLSQGQKRRLSVATMVIDNQKMLLLDEPTFGQDALSNIESMNLLQKRYQMGTTIIIITHDMELVYHYATRVIVLSKGKVVADCPPKELWEKPFETLQSWQLNHPIPIQLKKICGREVLDVSTSS